MITQADSDVWGRLECVLLVGEAVAGLNADAPAPGLLVLMDGCGGNDLLGVLEYVDAVQDRPVAGDPGLEIFFVVGLLFLGNADVYGILYPDGIGYRYKKCVDGPDNSRLELLT